jgi:hypothetical protein
MTGVVFLKLHSFGNVNPIANTINVFRSVWLINLAGEDYLTPGDILFVKHSHVKISHFI